MIALDLLNREGNRIIHATDIAWGMSHFFFKYIIFGSKKKFDLIFFNKKVNN